MSARASLRTVRSTFKHTPISDVHVAPYPKQARPKANVPKALVTTLPMRSTFELRSTCNVSSVMRAMGIGSRHLYNEIVTTFARSELLSYAC
jgi:hypothetical protein